MITARRLGAVLSALLLLAAPICNRAASEEAAGITVASWNIEWLGDGTDDEKLRGNKNGGKHLRGAEDFARLRGIAAGLNADILVLQEIENEAAVRRVLPPDGDWQIFVSRRKIRDPAWAQLVAIAVRKHSGLRARRLTDLRSLALEGNYLRNGVDLEIAHGAHRFRLLGIHLKSGCFSESLVSNKHACKRLAKQLPALEAWIEARADGSVPFVIAGDWNRRIGEPGDEFWAKLNDGDPPGLRLTRLSDGVPRRCWNTKWHKKPFVNHIVLGASAEARIWAASNFAEYPYAHEAALRPRLSDHCPVAAKLRFTAPY